MFSFNESDEKVVEHLKKYGIDTTDNSKWKFEENGKGRCIIFETGQTLVRLLNYPITNEDYSFLQHEIFHAVHFIMRRINTKLKVNSCEPFAYLIGYLTKEVYNKI